MRASSPMLGAVLGASVIVLGCAGPRTTAGSSVEPASANAVASPRTEERTPSPSPTEPPPSTVAPVPPSDSFGAGLLYTCVYGTAAFPIELLETSPSRNLNPDPTPALIRWPVPTTAVEWWLLARTETHAEFVGRDADGRSFEQATLERDGDGVWNAVGWGGCGFHAVVPGVEESGVLGWWIRDQDWPEPGDHTLHVRIRTWCPQTLTDRMLEPIVRYAPDRIIAIVTARPLAQQPSSCGLDQVADATIELDEPVGDRLILDASTWPGRDAHVKTQEMGVCCG